MVISQPRLQGRRSILTSIRRQGPVPRVDLAAQTGLSRATVTTITAELIDAGLIEEVHDTPSVPGLASPGRGRPKVDLRLRGSARLVAGMKIADRTVSMALTDFAGDVLAEHIHDLTAPSQSPAALVRDIRTGLETLVASHGGISALSGVGVGIAGVVDVPGGRLHWSPSLTERNVPLCDLLDAAIGLPIFLDNDANLVAVAEKNFGLGRTASDFIVITLESGVGMGIVIDNRLYRGTRGCGAEFGHTKVHLDGALCRCGQRGCLEAYVADYALLREAQVAGGQPQTVAGILEAAKRGEKLAANIVQRAGRMFAMGLANVVNIFDPQLIILAGSQMQFSHLYAEDVIALIRDSIVQIDQPPPQVLIHDWGDLMWAKGAAAYALEGVETIALAGLSEDAA